MAELDEKLSGLLSSPDTMEQIINLVKAFTSVSPESQTEPAVAPDTAAGAEPEATEAALTDGGEPSVLSKLDPNLISTVMSVFSEYSKDDDGIKLMRSLRPHLHEDIRTRADRAIEALRLSRSARSILRSLKGGSANVFKI